jgi:hypothetical protein
MGVGDQPHAPAALPPGKTRYPLYSRLGGTQGRSGWVRKISPTPGFDPRTVQPVASRYTDWAVLAHTLRLLGFLCGQGEVHQVRALTCKSLSRDHLYIKNVWSHVSIPTHVSD